MSALVAVKTRFGRFEVDRSAYKANDDGDGVEMHLRFVPGPRVDASLIALVQIANSIVDGAPEAINGSTVIRHHSIPAGEPGAGFHVDQDPANRNPLFAVNAQPPGSDDLGAGITLPFFGNFGSRQRGSDGRVTATPATLRDLTHLVDARPRSLQRFETCSLAVGGAQALSYFGSVSWGWEMDEHGRVRPFPLQLVSEEAPSAVFLRAAAIWNRSRTADGELTIALPIEIAAGATAGRDAGVPAGATDGAPALDFSRLDPEQLETLRALLENLITEQSPSRRPDRLSPTSHSSHAQS